MTQRNIGGGLTTSDSSWPWWTVRQGNQHLRLLAQRLSRQLSAFENRDQNLQKLVRMIDERPVARVAHAVRRDPGLM